MKGSAERERYLELRREGTDQWEAFRQVNAARAGGNYLSQATCQLWERWFRSEQGLPRRERSQSPGLLHPR